MDCFTEDPEREKIRKELSEMSFEELQKLKERIGIKVYNQTVLGAKKKEPVVDFKRANKNRPREESSKRPVQILREVVPIKKKLIRDPRYDNNIGEFNKEVFQKSYSFLKDIKRKEKEKLQKELWRTVDPEKKKEIKIAVQRLENQEKEELRKQKRQEQFIKEKQNQIASLKEGEKPRFIKKSERKVLDLLEKYEELKNSGKIQKHIERKNKKILNKDRKKYSLDQTNS